MNMNEEALDQLWTRCVNGLYLLLITYYLLLPVRLFFQELGKMQDEIIRVLALGLDSYRKENN